MNLTLWILVLAGGGAILFFGRRRWQKKSQTAQFDRVKRVKAAEEAELDRLACLDLGKSLSAKVPSGRNETAAKASGGEAEGEVEREG